MSRWPQSTLDAAQRQRLADLRAARIAGVQTRTLTARERSKQEWAAARRHKAELAARLAHDEPLTRDRAALIHRVPIAAVVAAWNRLYPNEHRERT